MARLLLTSQKLVLSKPGFNVETADFSQQLFNSDFSQLLEFGRFSYAVPSSTWSKSFTTPGGKNGWATNHHFSLPKSFPNAPLVFVSVQFGGSGGYWDNKTFVSSNLGAFSYENGNVFWDGFSEPNTAISVNVQVHATTLQVIANSIQYGGPIGLTVKYRVLEQTV